MHKSSITLLFIFICMSCAPQKPSTNSSAIDQGIIGEVTWLEGNQMPGPSKSPQKSDPAKPIIREIHIYKITNVVDTESKGTKFTKIKGAPVKKIMSDEKGKFSASLPPGEYSIFVKEEDGYFANIFDSDNNIHPVVVNKDKVTEVKIKVDYNAAY